MFIDPFNDKIKNCHLISKLYSILFLSVSIFIPMKMKHTKNLGIFKTSLKRHFM